MNIGSGEGYPSSALSNFAGHRFEVDGVQCNSMEGFLQSLKVKSPDMQKHVCTLIGKAAKFAGKKHNRWKRDQVLYWGGKEIDRHSEEYQELLDKAFNAMYEQSESFRNALIASKGSTLEHSIGRRDPRETVLTISEFIRRLNKLRNKALGVKAEELPSDCEKKGSFSKAFPALLAMSAAASLGMKI